MHATSSASNQRSEAPRPVMITRSLSIVVPERNARPQLALWLEEASSLKAMTWINNLLSRPDTS